MADNETRIRITAIDEATAKLNTIRAAAGDLTGSFSRLQGALGAIGLSAAVGGLAIMAQRAIDAQDEMSKLSQKVGVAVGELSQLRYAADLSGVSTQGLTNGIKTLSQRMTEAADATTRSAKLLKVLGVDTAAGPAKAIETIANAFAKLPDGVTKSALAVELFGKAGLDLVPFLNQGADGIRKLKEEAERLGLKMNTETARAAEAFNDNMRAVKSTTEALGISLVNAVAPALQRISQDMKEAAIEGGLLKAVLQGLRTAWAEAFFGDPVSERTEEIKREISELEGLYDKGPGLLEKILGTDQADKIAERIRKLRVELAGLESFKGVGPAKSSGAPSRDGGLGGRLRDVFGAGAGADPGVNLLLQLQQEYAKLNNLTRENETLERVLLDLKKSGNEKIAKDLRDRIVGEAKLIDELKKRLRVEAYLNEEHQRELDAAAERGRSIEQLSNQWEEATEELENELRLIGLTNIDRQKAVLLEKARLDIIAAGDNTAAVRDIQEGLRKQLSLLTQITGAQRDFNAAQEQMRDQVAIWDELSNVGARFLSDLAANGREAFKNLRQYVKDFARDLLALFAKRWLLSVGASLTGNATLAAAAGQVGQGTLAGAALGWAGTGTGPLSSIVAGGSEFLSAAAGNFVGPALPGSAAGLGQSAYALLSNPVTIAIAAAAAIAYYFRDKGENWTGRLGFGAGAQAYTTEGVFGREGFQYLAGQDEANRTIQAFMASTRPLDQQLALRLTPDQIARITEGLTGYNAPGARRTDGQPAEFAFGKNDDSAAGQLTLEYLQQKYGRVFDEIDTQFAQFIRGYTGTSEDLLTAIGEFAGVLNGLDALDIAGFNIGTLRAFQREGEELGATFTRIAEGWNQYQSLFLTEGEKLARAQTSLAAGFAELGIAVPTSKEEFKKLVDGLDLSTEAGRTLFEGLMQLAPAFAAVTDAAAGLLAGFDALMSQARPGYSTSLAQSGLESATNRFIERNPWAQGLDWRYVAQQISTIQREDFQRYSPESQAIINEILGYQNQLNAATSGFTSAVSGASSALTDYASSMRDAQKGLRDWAVGKLLGSESTLAPADQLSLALDEYQRALSSGDISAFQGAADALLREGRDFYASGEGYSEILNRVLADAERLGGFSLGRTGPAASIDQMRKDLTIELRLARDDNAALRLQVNDLIRTLRETSGEQTRATREAAETTSRAVVNAVESLGA